MKISEISVKNFRRFVDLTIKDIPQTAKLVVLAGPNGSGKSSLFDAFLMKYRQTSGIGYSDDLNYFSRSADLFSIQGANIQIEMHAEKKFAKGALYIRSAYRNDPEFVTDSLSRSGSIIDNMPLRKLIQTDATVAINYGRLASQAMEDVFVNEEATTTLGDFREKMIGEIRDPLNRLFPDLTFIGVGNPLIRGTFQFKKGAIENFDYQNLSGGEKAVFDLILDLVVKRRNYSDSIFCIDEPEAHLNTKIQGGLLQELLELIPDNSQLWIASHSIGMMRKARELYDTNPESVVFLDFGNRDFDIATTIAPQKPTRKFWQHVLQVAVDDLAALVSPRVIVICEGDPIKNVPGKNVEHDARIYSMIFSEALLDVTFISAGSSSQISGDFIALAAAIPKIASGISVRRLIDLDDNSPTDVANHNQKGITVLGRRHIESYLYDDEILIALCDSEGKPDQAAAILGAKQKAIADSTQRGNPADDTKSAAGSIYTEVKRILSLKQVGNDRHSFARDILAPLVKQHTNVYKNLQLDIFGH